MLDTTRSDAVPLVGRAAEQALLTSFLDEVTTRGRALVLRGEPGIGKSRLHDRGVTVPAATGVQSEAHLLFAGLHQLLPPARDRASPTTAPATNPSPPTGRPTAPRSSTPTPTPAPITPSSRHGPRHRTRLGHLARRRGHQRLRPRLGPTTLNTPTRNIQRSAPARPPDASVRRAPPRRASAGKQRGLWSPLLERDAFRLELKRPR